jgi:hypothetical protein
MNKEKRLFEQDFMDRKSPQGIRSPQQRRSPGSIKKSPSNAPRMQRPILFNIESNLQAQINSVIITD